MSDGEIVKEFDVIVGVIVRRWDVSVDEAEYFPEGCSYDWISDRGESDELFTSIEEAVQDANRSIGDR